MKQGRNNDRENINDSKDKGFFFMVSVVVYTQGTQYKPLCVLCLLPQCL